MLRTVFLLSTFLLGCVDLDAPGACAFNAALCVSDAPLPDASEVSADDGTAVDTGPVSLCDAASPPCMVGDVEKITGTCPSYRQTRTRTCNSNCTWDPPTDCTTLPSGWDDMAASPLKARASASGAWTGKEFIVWGGQSAPSAFENDGAAYSPSLNTWRTFPTAPIAGRAGQGAAWTGSSLVIWGGQTASSAYADDGALLDMSDPTKPSWKALPASSGLLPRSWPSVTWASTTSEVIVWGGGTGSGLGSAFFADGAAYSTKTGTWRKLPTSPLSARWEHAAISTDSGVLIYGGIGTDCGGPCGDGATFDPKTNTWTMLPKPPSALPAVRFPAIARSDSAVILWGGATDGGQSNTGAIFDLTARGWKEMSLPGSARAEGGAYGGASWFAAGKFWSWGGQGASGPLSSGASYDVASSMWKAMATGPVARLFAASAWTGSEELIWGGAQKVDPYYLADGKIYRP